MKPSPPCLAAIALALCACGGARSNGGSGGGGGSGGESCKGAGGGDLASILIEESQFYPPNLNVTPGTTVVVENWDSTPHSVTSEAKEGDFTSGPSGGVFFDTGVFSTGSKSFQVSWVATPGAVVHYFDRENKGDMAGVAEPTLTVVPHPAQ